jgi:heat shock protein HspQ
MNRSALLAKGFRAPPAERGSADWVLSMKTRIAKYSIGQVVKHRVYPFRGVIYDVDPIFANTEEWWLSIPAEVRPSKDQPFYHLFAENADTQYVAYVSEQNLVPDESGEPVRHPQVDEIFVRGENGFYRMRAAPRSS